MYCHGPAWCRLRCLTQVPRPERLELDRRRAARALAAGAVDAGAADAADRAFLRLMLRLLSAVGPMRPLVILSGPGRAASRAPLKLVRV